MKWEYKKIKSLCTKLTSGGTPSRKKPEFYVDGTIPWLKTKELKDCNIYDAEEYITEEALKQSSAKLFPINTVLIAMYGDGRTITSLGILKRKAATNQACCAFFANPDICNYQYLFYVLRFHRGALIKRALGGAQRNLSVTKISDFKVIAPPITSQDKIASILSAYDDLIENNLKRIKILEEMAQMIYREWFVNFRFPGHEKVKMVDSSIGKIPEGWEVNSVENKFIIVLGGTPSRKKLEYWENGTVPWINSGKVNELRIIDESEFITELGLKKSATKMMPPKTTVLAITGATLGQVSFLTIDACANQSVVGIYDDKNIYNEYIYLKFNEIIDSVIAKAGGGAQQHINKDIVNKTQICIPVETVINNFNSIARPLFGLLENLLLKNKTLRETRDLLLPKLISGELDVEGLEIKISEGAA